MLLETVGIVRGAAVGTILARAQLAVDEPGFGLEPYPGYGLDRHHQAALGQAHADAFDGVAEQREQSGLFRDRPILERARIHHGTVAGPVTLDQVAAQSPDGAAQRQFLDHVRPEHVHRVGSAYATTPRVRPRTGDKRKRAVAPLEIAPQYPARKPNAIQRDRGAVNGFDCRHPVHPFRPGNGMAASTKREPRLKRRAAFHAQAPPGRRRSDTLNEWHRVPACCLLLSLCRLCLCGSNLRNNSSTGTTTPGFLTGSSRVRVLRAASVSLKKHLGCIR